MDHFSEKDSALAMIDVFHAVQYLHEIGLVHRDLKVCTFRQRFLDVSLTARSQLENLMYASDDPSSDDYHTVKVRSALLVKSNFFHD